MLKQIANVAAHIERIMVSPSRRGAAKFFIVPHGGYFAQHCISSSPRKPYARLTRPAARDTVAKNIEAAGCRLQITGW